MTKLKTLKDMFEIETWFDKGISVKSVKIEELKQEAIKHLKRFQDTRPKKVRGIKEDKETFPHQKGWILNKMTERDLFFLELGKFQSLSRFIDITEEDLDGKK